MINFHKQENFKIIHTWQDWVKYRLLSETSIKQLHYAAIIYLAPRKIENKPLKS